jgi:hypothetical protein
VRRLSRTALAASVLAATVAGCAADGRAGDGGDQAGRDAERVRHELQLTYEQTWGDPRTRHAAEVIGWVEPQERFGACLAERGAGYEPEPFVDVTAPDPGPLSWYDPLVPVDGSGEVIAPAEHEPVHVPVTRTWPGPPPTADDIGACLSGPPEAPAVDPALDDALYQLVTDVLGDRTQVDGYRDCLHANGFEAATRNELVDAVLAERGADGAPGPRERDAVVADAACRAQAHREAMAALDEPLTAFRREHAAELTAADGRAADLRRRAEAAAGRMGLAVTWW